MTKELQSKFLKQITTDKKLQDDLAQSKTPEEAHKVVVKAGYNIKLDEFKVAMGQLNAAVNQQSGELSENDLEMVAGGRSDGATNDVVAVTSIVGASAGVVAAGATAAA